MAKDAATITKAAPALDLERRRRALNDRTRTNPDMRNSMALAILARDLTGCSRTLMVNSPLTISGAYTNPSPSTALRG
jgi:hypothetical protein